MNTKKSLKRSKIVIDILTENDLSEDEISDLMRHLSNSCIEFPKVLSTVTSHNDPNFTEADLIFSAYRQRFGKFEEVRL